jgi:gluconolactonase
MHPSLKVYDNKVYNFINKNFEIETLASDCLFTEGPTWNAEGFYLFSDIPANCIYKIEEGKGKEVFIQNSGTNNPGDPDLKPDQTGSNALAYHRDGDLLVCQHGSHAISKYDGNALKPFITSYSGRPFNSPNDLVLHGNGSIYFSDPPYGLRDGKLNPEKFQPVAAVYCFKDGELDLINDRYQYPNGVCLSPDESILYICSNKPFEKFISCHDTATNRFLHIFAEENSDGIKCDRKENVYLCNKDGIIILNEKGERLALIQLPTVPANICWGGKGLNDLFVTARERVFVIRNLQR